MKNYIVPNDWSVVHLRDCCNCLDNKRAPLNSEQRRSMSGPYPYLGANGQLDSISEYCFDEDIIMLAEDGGHFDEFEDRPIAYQFSGKCWVNNHAHVVRARCKEDQSYIFYSLQHKDIRIFLNGGTRAKLNKSDLMGLPIPMPPTTRERQKIAEILGACDEAIEAQERLIAQKQQRKKGLMQKLLTGEVRFPEFEGTADWKYIPLGKVSTRLMDKAGTQELDVLSITAGRGYVAQKDKFSKVIAGRNYTNYVVLEKGDFSYNKGNSLRFPQGCIYRLDEYDRGAVPNVFYSFRMDPDSTVSGFYVQLFKMGYQNKQLRAYINSGVRNDGLLNLKAKDFFKMQVPVPSSEEQQVLSDLFESLDKEITLFQKQLEQLKQQKKGLMQQLLTGKVRVKV